MNEKNLVICDREVRYARSLGDNISQRRELALRVQICTNLEHVMQFQQRRTIHMLIIDEGFAKEEREKMKAEQIFVLTKERCEDLGDRETEVYKFQSANQILSVVLSTYYEKTSQNILKRVKKSKQRIIAVYSPIHRVGKTTFAIALGEELAKKEKTLYLNLEEYPDIGGRFVQAEGRNLSDLLYYLRQENGNAPLRLSTMLAKKGELDYVPPMPVSTDLKAVTLEEWTKLLEVLLKESVYENIVLDLSESVQGLFELLKLCDRIYMPVREDAVSVWKLNQYEENLKRLQITGLEQYTYRFAAAENMEECARKQLKEEW